MLHKLNVDILIIAYKKLFFKRKMKKRRGKTTSSLFPLSYYFKGSGKRKKVKNPHTVVYGFFWGGLWESNPRPPGPQPGALTN